MPDIVVAVVAQDPAPVELPEDLSVSTPQEDMVVVLPVEDLVAIPLQQDLAINVPLQDMAITELEGGPPGPQGPPGPSGSSEVVVFPAAQALGGHRVVKPVPGNEVDYASSNVATDGDKILGITQTAAVEDADVVVQVGGLMTEGSWNWTVGGAVYCGIDGVLTQVPPTVGFVCRVAKALTPTQILINVEEAFILA